MESEQTVKGLGSSNLPLSSVGPRLVLAAVFAAAAVALASSGARADATARVVGQILDPLGRPVAGFPLRIKDDSGRGIETRTNHDGRFFAIGLSPGEIDVALEGATFQRSLAMCRVDAGFTAHVTFAAIPGPGYVTEPCHVEPPGFDLSIVR